jgi:glycosyltransferase involved in cell wall biosynthesis
LARRDQKLVVTLHNYVLDPFMRQYSSPAQRLYYRTALRFLTRRALQRADIVTAVSGYTAELTRGDLSYSDTIQVVPNGVNTSLFHPATTPSKRQNARVLFSGNLTRRKGVDTLLRIARLLPSHITLVVAHGPRRQPSKYDRSGKDFETLGHVPHRHMPGLYRSVDMLLAPTVREGLSLSVLEAMACGLPVVASRCSSLSEQVADGLGGHLCSIGDAEDFAERIVDLAGNPARRREMGAFNRNRVLEQYSLDAMVNGYRDVFSELLA